LPDAGVLDCSFSYEQKGSVKAIHVQVFKEMMGGGSTIYYYTIFRMVTKLDAAD